MKFIMYQFLRDKLKAYILEKLSDAMLTREVRPAISKIYPIAIKKDEFLMREPPYQGLGSMSDAQPISWRDDIVFITGRYRSGSTMLWNIFRQLDGFTSYYEPFNERRWFDSSFRGELVDASHLNVDNYWEEYNGLEGLAAYYDEDWVKYDLYMSHTSYNFKMKRYIEELIEGAKKRPVLQFNRMDFRLPWLRVNFPNAKILHIYRHPRDQWCSVVGGVENFPLTERCTFKDRFYLDVWSKDLERVFPFLSKVVSSHPYQRFYLLWRLSYSFGRMYSDYSVGMEKFSSNVPEEMKKINHLLGVADGQKKKYEFVMPQKEGKWRNYATNEWFSGHESYCDDILEGYFNGACEVVNVTTNPLSFK